MTVIVEYMNEVKTSVSVVLTAATVFVDEIEVEVNAVAVVCGKV